MNSFEQAKQFFFDGLSHFENGSFDKAEESFVRALELMPDRISLLTNLSATQIKLGKYAEARNAVAKVIALDPGNSEAWLNLGLIENWSNNPEKSIECFDRSIENNPGYGEAWMNRGVALNALERFGEALDSYDKALQLQPSSAEVWSNKAVSLDKLRRYDEALISYDKALALKPDYSEAWSNKGVTLTVLKRYSEALTCHERATQSSAEFAKAWFNKAATLNKMGRYDDALIAYDKAIALDADYSEAWSNKGITLFALRRYSEALTCHERAIQADPASAEAWSNKGYVLIELKRFDDALSCYSEAFRLNPEIKFLLGSLIHTKMMLCDWSHLDSLQTKLFARIENGEMASTPFDLLSLDASPSLQRKAAEIYIAKGFPADDALGPIARKPAGDKIRIGYFSSDFGEHPVSYLTAELFETHDRSRFEIIAFSFGPTTSGGIGDRLKSAFDRFIDVHEQSDRDVAVLARGVGIDIAIDLGGLTGDARTGVFACRAAPIQASYIGYLGTMGAGYIDYLLADSTIIPEDCQKYYSEKIVYLQNYQVNDSKRAISDRSFTRQELGLPENGFVFCCFNNNYKISPATFDSWMRILKAVAGSVLFLYGGNRWAEGSLKKAAQARGVDAQRLVFGESLPRADYLARYRAADLFLDTLPYNAGTTASDALWAGLPVLTCLGHAFAGRVAASLLNSIGLPELIAQTPEQYESLAIGLATNPDEMKAIKGQLAEKRLTAPLFDTPRFTRDIEAAYTKLYQRHQAGLPVADVRTVGDD